jgi:hypothetical protein
VAVAVGAAVLGLTGYGKDSRIVQTTFTQTVGTTTAKSLAIAPKQTAPVVPAPPPARTTPAAKRPARRAAPTPKLRLAIRATSTASWLEVRTKSASGPLVFSGELAAGRTLTLKGNRFWARFGAAGNLAIAVNGRRVPLQGTLEHVFSAPARR